MTWLKIDVSVVGCVGRDISVSNAYSPLLDTGRRTIQPTIQPHKILINKRKLKRNNVDLPCYRMRLLPCLWIRQMSRDVLADALLLFDNPFLLTKLITGMWKLDLANFDCDRVYANWFDILVKILTILYWWLLLLAGERLWCDCLRSGRATLE